MSDYLMITLITLPDSDTGMETRTRIPNLVTALHDTENVHIGLRSLLPISA